MKALLIRDWKFMTDQKRYLMIVLAVILVMAVSGTDPSFLVFYVAFMMVFMLLGIVSSDERGELAYLLTMPISRRQYVVEKYVFGIGISCVASIGIQIICGVIQVISHGSFNVSEVPELLLMPLLFCSWILGISLPVYIRFGADKGKGIVFGMTGIVALSVLAVNRYLHAQGRSIEEMLSGLNRLPEWQVVTVVIGMSCAVVIISMLIAFRCIENKEF